MTLPRAAASPTPTATPYRAGYTVHRGGALASDYGFDANGNRTRHRIGLASPLRGQSWPCLGALPAGGDSTGNDSFDAQDRLGHYMAAVLMLLTKRLKEHVRVS